MAGAVSRLQCTSKHIITLGCKYVSYRTNEHVPPRNPLAERVLRRICMSSANVLISEVLDLKYTQLLIYAALAGTFAQKGSLLARPSVLSGSPYEYGGITLMKWLPYP